MDRSTTVITSEMSVNAEAGNDKQRDIANLAKYEAKPNHRELGTHRQSVFGLHVKRKPLSIYF